MMIKLLHVIAGTDPRLGGVSQAMRTMISGLTELGIHNEVVCLDEPHTDCFSDNKFAIHNLGPAIGPWQYSRQLAPWLMEHLQRFNVVIVHGLWLYHGYAIQQAIRKLKTQPVTAGGHTCPKVFLMPHGMLDPYFQHAPGRRLKSLRNWMYWKLIESRVVHEADGELFTCAEECRLARKTFKPYEPKTEIVVGLGVEEPPQFVPVMREQFRKKCVALGERSFILFLSRIHEKKGIELLIRAYLKTYGYLAKPRPRLSADHLLTDEVSHIQHAAPPAIVIAGPGLETAYGKKIQQMVFDNPILRNAVFFTGMLTGDAKWGAFYCCDAFILPSHQENFGIAVVEALACSKPVLISRQVNIWQEIEESGGGLVADDSLMGTQEILIHWLTLSTTQKTNMCRKARETYLKFFAVKPAARCVLEAIS